MQTVGRESTIRFVVVSMENLHIFAPITVYVP